MGEIALVPERRALINVDLQRHFVDSAPDGLAVVDSVNRLAANDEQHLRERSHPCRWDAKPYRLPPCHSI